jgi:hypothetical protein
LLLTIINKTNQQKAHVIKRIIRKAWFYCFLMLMQGHLAALAASITILEAATDTLAADADLGPQLDKAFGNQSAQAEASSAAATTAAYQVGAAPYM